MKSSPKTVRIGVLVYPGCMRSGAVMPFDVLRVANTLSAYRPVAERLRFEYQWLGARGDAALDIDGLAFTLAPLAGARLDALVLPGVAHDAAPGLARILDGLAPEQAAIARYVAEHQTEHRAENRAEPGAADPAEPMAEPAAGPAAGGGLLVSNCSSTSLVARTGLLDGRRATTSWWLAAWFRQQFPRVTLDADALVVQDGAFVSSGGVGSTLDLALWLVGHFGGEALRQLTAKVMVMDAHRASQAPYVADAILGQAGHPTVERARRWLNARLDGAWTTADLAAHCATSQRTLLRRFQEALGVSPVQYAQQLRVERAKALLESTGLPLEEITARCGYEDAATFSKVFKRWVALTPREYRQRFGLVR